jgi:hypothetical protein
MKKATWCWYKKRHVDKWNRIKDPKISRSRYCHPILTKVPKIYIRQKAAPLTSSAGKTEYSHVEE